jgi:hypothetical protein
MEPGAEPRARVVVERDDRGARRVDRVGFGDLAVRTSGVAKIVPSCQMIGRAPFWSSVRT